MRTEMRSAADIEDVGAGRVGAGTGQRGRQHRAVGPAVRGAQHHELRHVPPGVGGGERGADTDERARRQPAAAEPVSLDPGQVPVLVVAYAVGNIIDAGFQQLRDIMFASEVREQILQTPLLWATFGGLPRVKFLKALEAEGLPGAPARAALASCCPVAALLAAHPYETPAYDLLPLSVQQQDAPGSAVDGLVRHWPAPRSRLASKYDLSNFSRVA